MITIRRSIALACVAMIGLVACTEADSGVQGTPSSSTSAPRRHPTQRPVSAALLVQSRSPASILWLAIP